MCAANQGDEVTGTDIIIISVGHLKFNHNFDCLKFTEIKFTALN